MKLNSARQAWHDCTYAPSRSSLFRLADRSLLGTAVQATDRGITADRAIHSALAGWVQSAIATLPAPVRVFGEFMYGAGADNDIREAAEDVVLGLVLANSPRMTAAKRERLEWVVKGVMRRYRYMHQGGQSANADPLHKPEAFRAWLLQEYGVQLDSCAWARNWAPFVQRSFECCEALDSKALGPVAAIINQMKSAA
jgi:hypothetical protein